MAAGRIISGALALLLLLVLPTRALTGGGGTQWASPELEALDERRDAEILQAVVDSMAAWQRRRDALKHTASRERRAAAPPAEDGALVCYEAVGCFRGSGPFSYLDVLPSPPHLVDTTFLFYSRAQPQPIPLPFANISSSSPAPPKARPARGAGAEATPLPPHLSASLSQPSGSFVEATGFGPADWVRAGLNASAPTKVIVHGFGSSCGNVWVFEMRSALMSVEECNVICVDWEAGATIPNYVRAAANTRLVGKQLAMLLGRLRDDLGLDLSTVHLIGFSLGAHVAGFAGAELNSLISRITGLDPAGPLFENQDPEARLDASDAAFVDVIHSNGENLILGGLGSWQPMGHVDFYPNGGRMQSGCTNLFVGAVSDILWSSREAHGRSLCNHRRAYKFFTDSVSPRCHFPAVPCESYDKFIAGHCFPCSSQMPCGNMGYYADRSSGRGSLYLITRDEEPFCAHQLLLRVESSPSPLPVVSYGKIQVTLLGNSPNANETFVMTRKDDEELQAGGVLARIIVPHPVMEDGPVKVELLYTAYSGWISSGLAKWSIDKISLGDSFGKSSSFCKRGLILESGTPVTVPIFPGDCNPPSTITSTTVVSPAQQPASDHSEEESEDKQPAEMTPPTTTLTPVTTGALATAYAEGLDEGLHATAKSDEELTGNDHATTPNSLHPGGGTPPTQAPTLLEEDPLVGAKAPPDDDSSWQPLDGHRQDAARAFVIGGNASKGREWRPRHIPLLSRGAVAPPWLEDEATGRGGLDPPPIHAPITWHQWRVAQDETTTTSTTSTTMQAPPEEVASNASSWSLAPVIETVQLLPQRLVAFLARAEEYARVTLSGMVNGTASSVSSSSSNEPPEGRRKAKLFAGSVGSMGRGLAQLYSSEAVVGKGEGESGTGPRYIPLQRPMRAMPMPMPMPRK
ncbi:uncharacterized protein LOC124172835 [Ischnura elegans]|uniref:uncharacterized protein LOC124172835 n=1 Tax=Ischnura elegans TaxID=197161 RepID=UPI001ED8707F|nr:uncharacterized protein LOC124172835 [Ischnura elegans]